ncbi:AP2 domain transcription factor AP2VIIa-6 [Toxoplasma gondii ME49]|uniref:AP2 domain transcription factor AP2VIIa-6 n=1 Tax=Toxoplasma gondii (strain ATCC 50611 / Me49) TaxID=508771 RepID=S8F2Z9_TOXGM|nr:AP2 domain transcription factor AP2VIIa-6 [Toxoplasma gondii ME49]EPT30161.1 AP2 domain transcription factor AP2VIIa-6 [Toxoplasma gondii ME49]|eukprot:XP_018637373.1 AP2 domain transcription factor AP2VIIa-6 [Toxoplasma gondii ME49]
MATLSGSDAVKEVLPRFSGSAPNEIRSNKGGDVEEALYLPCLTNESWLVSALKTPYQGDTECIKIQPEALVKEGPPEIPGHNCQVTSIHACKLRTGTQHGDSARSDLRRPPSASPANMRDGDANKSSNAQEINFPNIADVDTLESGRVSSVDLVRTPSVANLHSSSGGQSSPPQDTSSKPAEDPIVSDAMESADHRVLSEDSCNRTLTASGQGGKRRRRQAGPVGVSSGGLSCLIRNVSEEGGGASAGEDVDEGLVRPGSKAATPERSRQTDQGNGQMNEEPWLPEVHQLKTTFREKSSLAQASKCSACTPPKDASAPADLPAEPVSQGRPLPYPMAGKSRKLRTDSSTGRRTHPVDSFSTVDVPVESRTTTTTSATGSDGGGDAAPTSANALLRGQAMRWPDLSQPKALLESLSGFPSRRPDCGSSRAASIENEGRPIRLSQSNILSSLSAARIDLLTTRATKEELQKREQELQQQLRNSRQEQEILQALLGEMTVLRQNAEAAEAAEAAEGLEAREKDLGKHRKRDSGTRGDSATMGATEPGSNDRAVDSVMRSRGEEQQIGASVNLQVSAPEVREDSSDIRNALLQAVGLKRRRLATSAQTGRTYGESEVGYKQETRLSDRASVFGRHEASSVLASVASVLMGNETMQTSRGMLPGVGNCSAASCGSSNASDDRLLGLAACDSQARTPQQGLPPVNVDTRILTSLSTDQALRVGPSRLASAPTGASKFAPESLTTALDVSSCLAVSPQEHDMETLRNMEPRCSSARLSPEQEVLALLAASLGNNEGTIDVDGGAKQPVQQRRASGYAKLARMLPRINRLTFSTQTLMWVVRVQTRRTRLCKSFSVRKLGFLQARQAAIDFLMEFDHKEQQLQATTPSVQRRGALQTARSRRRELTSTVCGAPSVQDEEVKRDTGIERNTTTCPCCGGRSAEVAPNEGGGRSQLSNASITHSDGSSGCVTCRVCDGSSLERRGAHGQRKQDTADDTLFPGEPNRHRNQARNDHRGDTSTSGSRLEDDQVRHSWGGSGGAMQTVGDGEGHHEKARTDENVSSCGSSCSSRSEAGGHMHIKRTACECPVDVHGHRLCASCAGVSPNLCMVDDCGDIAHSPETSAVENRKQRLLPPQCLGEHSRITQTSCDNAGRSSADVTVESLRQLGSESCSSNRSCRPHGVREEAAGCDSELQAIPSRATSCEHEERLNKIRDPESTCCWSASGFSKRENVEMAAARGDSRDGCVSHRHLRQQQHERRKHAREDLALRARQLPHTVGVKFDPTCPRWIAHWKREGQRFFKSFSVEKNGFENAWNLAKLCRKRNAELAAATSRATSTPKRPNIVCGAGSSRRSVSGNRNVSEQAGSGVNPLNSPPSAGTGGLRGGNIAGTATVLPTYDITCQRQEAASVNSTKFSSLAFLAALGDYMSANYGPASAGISDDNQEGRGVMTGARWCTAACTNPESPSGDGTQLSALIPAIAGRSLLYASRSSAEGIRLREDCTVTETATAAAAETPRLRAFCNNVANKAVADGTVTSTTRDELLGTRGPRTDSREERRAIDAATALAPRNSSPLGGAAGAVAVTDMQNSIDFAQAASGLEDDGLTGLPFVEASWSRSADGGAGGTASDSRHRLAASSVETKVLHSGEDSLGGGEWAGDWGSSTREGNWKVKYDANTVGAGGGTCEGVFVASLDGNRMRSTPPRSEDRSVMPTPPAVSVTVQDIPAFISLSEGSEVAGERARPTEADVAAEYREAISSVTSPQPRGSRSGLKGTTDALNIDETQCRGADSVYGQLHHSEPVQGAVRLCSAMQQHRKTEEQQQRLGLANVGSGCHLVSSSGALSAVDAPTRYPQHAEQLSQTAAAGLAVPSIQGSTGDGSETVGMTSLLLLLSQRDNSLAARSAVSTCLSGAIPDTSFCARGSLLPAKTNQPDVATEGATDGAQLTCDRSGTPTSPERLLCRSSLNSEKLQASGAPGLTESLPAGMSGEATGDPPPPTSVDSCGNYLGPTSGTSKRATFLAASETWATEVLLHHQAVQGASPSSAPAHDLWSLSPTELVTLNCQMNGPGNSSLPGGFTVSGVHTSELQSDEGFRSMNASSEARIDAVIGVSDDGGPTSEFAAEMGYREMVHSEGEESGVSAANAGDPLGSSTVHSARTSAGSCLDDTVLMVGVKDGTRSSISGSFLGEHHRSPHVEADISRARNDSSNQEVDLNGAKCMSGQARVREQRRSFSLSEWPLDNRFPMTESMERNIRRRNSSGSMSHESNSFSEAATPANQGGPHPPGRLADSDCACTTACRRQGEGANVAGIPPERATGSFSGTQATYALLGETDTPGGCSVDPADDTERLSWAKVAVLMILRNLRDDASCRLLTECFQLLDASQTEMPELRALLSIFSNLIAEQRLPSSLPTDELRKLVSDVQTAVKSQCKVLPDGAALASSASGSDLPAI